MLLTFEHENASFSIVRSSELCSNSTLESCSQDKKAPSQICVTCDGIKMFETFEHENACVPIILIADGIFALKVSHPQKTSVS